MSRSSSAGRTARTMPWTVGLELRRRPAWSLVRAPFAWHGVAWGRGWRIFGRPILQKHRGRRIALSDGDRDPACKTVSVKPFCIQVVASGLSSPRIGRPDPFHADDHRS
jgi:hypothetical protein